MGTLFFYRHPRLLVILIAGICASGISTFFMLPRMEDPILRERVGVISTVFPGASAVELERLVAEPIEKALFPLDGIESFRTSCRAGSCNIVVQLADKVTDVDNAWDAIQKAIGPLEFPEDCQTPTVRSFPLKAYSSLLSIQSESGDLEACRVAALELRSRLELIRGTEEVLLFGDPGLKVHVIARPEKLAENGISFARFAAQVDRFFASEAIGEVDDNVQRIQLGMQPTEIVGMNMLKIRNGYGKEISIGDIADVELGPDENPMQKVRVDSKNSVVVAVRPKDKADINEWAENLDKQVAAMQKRFPQLSIREVFSQNEHIETRMRKLVKSLSLSTIVVVVVVFLLMGWRSMLVVVVILPLTLFLVAISMSFSGVPIHQISVTGVIVSLGLLIDNAIIVVDDVKKRIIAGNKISSAIHKSIKHLRFPLLGATVTTAFSFLPIALLPGPAGEFVGSMAFTVITAVIASYFVATIILPCLAGFMVRRSVVGAVSEEGFSYRPLSKSYFRFLKSCFRQPWVVVAIGILIPSMGFLVWKNLPVQFFPAADRNQIQVEVELDKSASIESLENDIRQLESILNTYPAVAGQNWFLGSSAPMFYYNVVPRYERSPHYAQAFLNLDGTSSANQQKKLIAELQDRLGKRLPHARVTVRRLEQGPPFDAPVEIIVAGPDVQQLVAIGQKIRKLLGDIPEVLQTRSDLQSSQFVSDFVPNIRACEEMGILPDEIQRELAAAVNGLPVGQTLFQGESIDITVRMRMDDGDIENSLLNLPLNSPVPMDPRMAKPTVRMLGDFQRRTSRSTIMKRNGEYINLIKGYITPSAYPSRVLNRFKQNWEDSKLKLPEGYRLEFEGEEEKRTAAESSLFATAPLFVCLILFLMVAIFGSFRSSLCIACVGVLTLGMVPLALAAFSLPFGFMALIGSMGLIGIAINDSIVVLAGLQDLDSRDRDYVDSVARVVFDNTRHILTTTLTTIAGFVPLIIYGGEFWPPMAIAICVGILGATLLAIIFLPSLFMVLNATLKPNVLASTTRRSKSDRS